MNFLELINKCLLELNYKQVNAMSELVKNDHKRIVAILNIINKEICNTDGWKFLLRRTNFVLPSETGEIENPVNGRILYLFIDGKRYNFCDDIEGFIAGNPRKWKYSSMSDKLLFPKFQEDKIVEIVYYTSDCVMDSDGVEKSDFEEETDVSLIPMPFAEQLLVYGACLRLKANPQYYKFSYWMSMYKEAMLNLKSKTDVSVLNAPTVNLYRN
jgi:hypothetical protein